jgi:serine phosphatase RsbU (regulator of sigma subunit)
MPVGKGELSNSFGLFEIPQGKSGILYLPTDGYSDQFGGEKGKKLKFSNMLKYMNEIYKNPLSEQSAILNSKFEKWKGELEQLDDVCIIGIKI